jgi:hypothetical protein
MLWRAREHLTLAPGRGGGGGVAVDIRKRRAADQLAKRLLAQDFMVSCVNCFWLDHADRPRVEQKFVEQMQFRIK